MSTPIENNTAALHDLLEDVQNLPDAVLETEKGAPNGVATLGSDGKVPSSQLPESGGVKSYYNQFSASDWSGGTMVISAATHGLAGTEVLAQFSALVSGTYYPNTWSAMESYATVNATTRAITLHSESAYAGAVLLIG